MISHTLLDSLGFEPIAEKLWAWGSYTVKLKTNQMVYPPVITWDEETKEAYAAPIGYSKIITSESGMKKLMDTVSFLMSSES